MGSRKNSIYQRSGSFDTLADSAQAVMAVLVGVGPPPPPLPSFDEIQRKFVWNSWQSWSACSETCGIGTRTRMRSCSRPTRVCEKFLDTKARETRRCRDQPCASWSNWANWTTCSKSCGEGVSIRRRQCSGNYCPGSSMSNRKCSVAACPARGVSADWEEWSSCNSCSMAAKQMRNVNALSNRRNARHLRWKAAHARYLRSASLCALLDQVSPWRRRVGRGAHVQHHLQLRLHQAG